MFFYINNNAIKNNKKVNGLDITAIKFVTK